MLLEIIHRLRNIRGLIVIPQTHPKTESVLLHPVSAKTGSGLYLDLILRKHLSKQHVSDFTGRILLFTSVNSLSKENTLVCVTSEKSHNILMFPVEIPPFLCVDRK